MLDPINQKNDRDAVVIGFNPDGEGRKFSGKSIAFTRTVGREELVPGAK